MIDKPTRADEIDAARDMILQSLQELEEITISKKSATRIAAAVLLAADEAKPKHLSTSSIIDRLRGVYVIPVNDGAGLLNGKDTFTRAFTTPPIQQEAAKLIEEQAAQIERLKKDDEHVSEG